VPGEAPFTAVIKFAAEEVCQLQLPDERNSYTCAAWQAQDFINDAVHTVHLRT
jgi:hypothetical protein